MMLDDIKGEITLW